MYLNLFYIFMDLQASASVSLGTIIGGIQSIHSSLDYGIKISGHVTSVGRFMHLHVNGKTNKIPKCPGFATNAEKISSSVN